MSEEKKIYHVDNPKDGPVDGVMMKTKCIRTDFIENPVEGEVPFIQKNNSKGGISASFELGIFSISDKESGVMLSVSIIDASEVLCAAFDASKSLDDSKNEQN